MTNLSKWLIIAIVAMMAFAGYGLWQEHSTNALLNQQVKADKTQIQTIQSEQAVKDKQAADQVAALQVQKQKVITVTQVVHALPTVVALPSAATQVTQLQAEAADKADPTAPAIEADDVIIPKASAKPLFDALADAKECAVELDDEKSKVVSLTEVDAVKDKEIQQQQQALKGGTKWRRVKTALKWAGIGAAVGAAAVAYGHH